VQLSRSVRATWIARRRFFTLEGARRRASLKTEETWKRKEKGNITKKSRPQSKGVEALKDTLAAGKRGGRKDHVLKKTV